MSESEPIDPAPDWAAFAAELYCPLCQYNLRGLERPRCPECGFVFSWAEIVRGQREQHPYLFELRFHLPFATVLSSQIIVFLAVLLMYLYTCGY